MENDNPPHLVTPTSVKAIISKIEAAQLIRTQEDISTQLSDILDNVNCAINRFQEELGYDLKEMAKPHQPEQKGKKRFILLEKIASFSKDAKTKEKHLYEILRWLGDWVSKHNFWQNWQEKNLQKSSVLPQPLSPEQMLQDNNITCTMVSEVKSMLQELLESTMFNKGEVKAISYMSTVVENLDKALILQHKENKSLEIKYKHLQGEMTKELNSQRLYFQKSIQVLESKRDALLKQVQVLGGKYHDLLTVKHALEFQLKMAQTASGLEEPVEAFMDAPELPKRETLPEKGIALEEPQQKLKEKEQFFSPLSSSHLKAWDSSTTPAVSTMTTDSRTEDVFAGHTESLEPVLLHSHLPQFPTRWRKLVEEAPEHEGKDQGDHFQEKDGGVQHRSYPGKCLSPGDSRKMLLESRSEHWEEELSWEKRRQQWLQEEEMWLQRQKKWTLLEQEHQEKVQQWEAEAAARQQWQKLTQPEEETRSPRRTSGEQKGSSEKQIFMTTSRWRNLEKSEPSSAPPPCRAQSARQSRKSHLPMSAHTQQPGQGNQRTLSLAESIQTPRTRQVSAKPKKCASFPISGTSVRRVTRHSLQKSPAPSKDKVYHINMEGQLRNLQILGSSESELALPQYLRSKALEVTAIAMELSVLRLQCLCQKYVHYRRFQSIRQEVIKHIGAIRQMRLTYKTQSQNVFLENIDRQQSLSLQVWTDRQKDLEEKHQECLHTMATMFPKLKKEWSIHLNVPVVNSAKPGKCKSPPVLLQRVRSSGVTNKQHWESVPLWIVGQQGSQMEAIWKTDVASSSYPIEKKTPASLPWDQLGGYPDIPRLLVVDEHPSHHKSLMSFKTRPFSASAIQRKEFQEPSEDPAELVRKMSSQ
ncbi:protein FAM186B isoform X2 [Mesocricetus auratus]|uniref:Protein FAM186B isoform X2 n=1 Tax=Mesocricetus auratus TaxID=10036 RepID=A0ABM2Y4J5_MESAU|nr:protein FAM186B isoform X2 [Mesocricetus auratus]